MTSENEDRKKGGQKKKISSVYQRGVADLISHIMKENKKAGLL